MGTKRVGLARVQALIENLDRAIGLEGSNVTVNSLISDEGVSITSGHCTITDGRLKLTSATKGIEATHTNVTQATSITTGVTASGHVGIITMHATAIAADENIEFTVTNTIAKTTSCIFLSMQDENTTDDAQLVCASHTHANGSFKITVANTDSAQASSATAVKIHYLLINPL